MFEKQVIFEVSGSQYSFNSMYVRTVEANIDIKPFPGMPDCIAGIAELRGEVVPVCDLHKKFNVPDAHSALRQIVFVNTSEGCLGCVVDAVIEIGAVAEELQYALPSIIRSAGTEYVAGILNNNGQLVTSVNADLLLSPDEKREVFAIIRKIREDSERSEQAKLEEELIVATKKAEAEAATKSEGVSKTEGAKPDNAVKSVSVVKEQKTVEEKPAEKKPAEKKPAEKKVAEKKTVEKKPAEKKPAEKKTVEKKPAEKKTVEKKPAEKKPAEKKPIEKKPVEKKLTARKSSEGKAATEIK